MWAKDRLGEIYRIKVRIYRIEMQIKELECSIASIGAIDYSKVPGSSSFPQETLGDSIAKLLELRDKAAVERVKMEVIKGERIDEIWKLTDMAQVQVLLLRSPGKRPGDT